MDDLIAATRPLDGNIAALDGARQGAAQGSS